MKLKLQCGCGSRFEFEVEPVNGRMPVSLACPTCGTDATELANEAMQERLRVPGAPALRNSGLRITGETAAPSSSDPPMADAATQTEAGAATEFCSRHRTEPAIETCRVCGKPICMKCMVVFGYICSPYCKSQVLERKLNIPECPHQKSVLADREYQALKRGVAAAAVTITAVVAIWVWYAWFGLMPKLVYSVRLSETATNDSFYDLAGPGRLLSLTGNQLTVMDVAAGRPVWSATLESAVTKGVSAPGQLDAIMTSNEVWLSLPSRLVHFNLKTGVRGGDVVLKAPATSVSHDDQSILIVSEPDGGGGSLTRIALPSGVVETEERTPPAQTTVAGQVKKEGVLPQPKSDHRQGNAPAKESRSEFVSAGVNAVELQRKLLESKIVYVETMKPRGASVLDSGNLNASQSLEASQEMMNDAQRQRTGGRRAEDLSRYQITLHRWFDREAVDWSGEVTGAPELFPLKTVDLLVTDKLVRAFDKANKNLWESKLTYRIREARERAEHGVPAPCLESGGVVYLADQGMLTAFDAAGGNVRWRLTTIGISRFQFDDLGMLYIDTTTADPEYLQYPDDIAVRKRVRPLLLKVEPATGHILWQGEKAGSTCLLSGKFVYEAGSSVASALLHLGGGEKYDFNLYRLDRAEGRELWRYYQPKRALSVTARKTWILLQFPDELQVLRFYSL